MLLLCDTVPIVSIDDYRGEERRGGGGGGI